MKSPRDIYNREDNWAEYRLSYLDNRDIHEDQQLVKSEIRRLGTDGVVMEHWHDKIPSLGHERDIMMFRSNGELWTASCINVQDGKFTSVHFAQLGENRESWDDIVIRLQEMGLQLMYPVPAKREDKH